MAAATAVGMILMFPAAFVLTRLDADPVFFYVCAFAVIAAVVFATLRPLMQSGGTRRGTSPQA
jgi:hypothetical protein